MFLEKAGRKKWKLPRTAASSRECKYKFVAFPANIFARRARGRQPISIWNEIFVLENRDNRGDGQDSLLVFFLKTGENNARTGRERRKGGVCRVYERWRNKESLDDVEGSARFRNGGGGGETSGRNSITKLQEPPLIETHSSSTWEEIAGEVICRNGYLEFKKIL